MNQRGPFLRACLVLALIGSALLGGCGRGPSGKYAPTDPMMAKVGSVEFKSGKVYITAIGLTTEGTYDVDGDKITIHKPGETAGGLVLTIEKDGTLSGYPGLGVLKKVDQ